MNIYFEPIKKIVEALKIQGARNDYIVNAVKEYLQLRVLNCLYNNRRYNQQLIFTGGICLRLCFALPRLSEDLDFDYTGNLDIEKLSDDLENYFSKIMMLPQVTTTIKGKSRKIYIKLPILNDLGLAFGGSAILYLKVEAAPLRAVMQPAEITPISREGLYFFIQRFSLSDLMAGKINAFLTRMFYKGKTNEVDFKGRDVFDLIWYAGQGIKPNFKRLEGLLAGTIYEGKSEEEILGLVQQKLNAVKKQHVLLDVGQFIQDQAMLENFLDHYLDIFAQYCRQY